MALPRLALVSLLFLSPPLVLLQGASLRAETAAETAVPAVSVAAYGEVLQFDRLFDVLIQDGTAQAQDLARAMLADGGTSGWDRAVAGVYDPRRLRARFNHVLRLRLSESPALTAAALDFFASDLGQHVLDLELGARAAFLDIATEEAARVAVDSPEAARDPKTRLIQRVIEAGDLVERNVAASLSGNLAFALALQETGAYGLVLPIDKLALDVWAQEGRIRADTGAWLRAYYGLAYAPLSEADLASYVEFLESPAGQHHLAAVFLAIEAALRPVSGDLGKAVGEASLADEI